MSLTALLKRFAVKYPSLMSDTIKTTTIMIAPSDFLISRAALLVAADLAAPYRHRQSNSGD